MILFAVVIGQEAKFYDTPFLAVNQFPSMFLIDIFRNQALAEFDAIVRNGELFFTFHQVDVDDEASEKNDFLAR